MSDYTEDPTPGDWDHRSGDCETHGVNVAHFRQKKALGPYFCVQCALSVLKQDKLLLTFAADTGMGAAKRRKKAKRK